MLLFQFCPPMPWCGPAFCLIVVVVLAAAGACACMVIACLLLALIRCSLEPCALPRCPHDVTQGERGGAEAAHARVLTRVRVRVVQMQVENVVYELKPAAQTNNPLDNKAGNQIT